MQPNDSLAEAIGLIGYAADGHGIGGVLKSRVADFRVDEIATTITLNPKGRFTVAKITLTNWETNRFCNNLAKKLGISRNRIFFAGTKDKRAVTSQIFVIDAPQFKVAEIEIPDVVIEVLGRTHQKIGFGNHRGNRFTIVVRGCAHPDGTPMTEEEALDEVEQLKSKMEENSEKVDFQTGLVHNGSEVVERLRQRSVAPLSNINGKKPFTPTSARRVTMSHPMLQPSVNTFEQTELHKKDSI